MALPEDIDDGSYDDNNNPDDNCSDEIQKSSHIQSQRTNHSTNSTKSSTKKALQYRKMTEAICEMLGDMGLVSFLPMNVQDGEVIFTYYNPILSTILLNSFIMCRYYDIMMCVSYTFDMNCC